MYDDEGSSLRQTGCKFGQIRQKGVWGDSILKYRGINTQGDEEQLSKFGKQQGSKKSAQSTVNIEGGEVLFLKSTRSPRERGEISTPGIMGKTYPTIMNNYTKTTFHKDV